MKDHKHHWVPYLRQAVGYWEKRECPGDGIYFNGRADICGYGDCSVMRFICEDPRYQIVEIQKINLGEKTK